VDFALTSEQEELRAQARAFLADNPSPTWAQLAELGWTGVSVPESDGGAGLSFLEEAVLLEELARALYHGPYFSTVALLLPALPAPERAAVAAGEASWTLALGPLVSDLDTAARVGVATEDGIHELVGCDREMLKTVDESRPLGVVSGGERGARLAGGEAVPALRRRAYAGLAMEACGVGHRALELAVEHASTREQFGRPIGSYQAVSHVLATTYMELELARSLSLWAAWCVAVDDPQAHIAATAAKAQAAEAAVAACERSIQVHGGIGFTWEHVLHRLYKRALGIQSWDASGADLRAEVAAALLDGKGA
jgi:alkylation response protein AidB-like acyl-CoA dehydrogenase